MELFCEINLRLEEIPNLLMILLFSLISQNSATGPERKDECKFTQPFQLRIDFQKQLRLVAGVAKKKFRYVQQQSTIFFMRSSPSYSFAFLP